MIQYMLPKSNSITHLSLYETASQAVMSGVFGNRRNQDMNEFMLYLAHFQYIPNFTHEVRIECKKAHEWFLSEFESEIKNCYFMKLKFY